VTAADRNWVLKIGSALLTEGGKGVRLEPVAGWARQIVLLRERGLRVVLVSSGAVAAGLQRLGRRRRPADIQELQAAAAVGQAGLIQAYEKEFQCFGVRVAQVLLTHEDIADRKRYLNARGTLLRLLEWQVMPIINENDTVSTEEIRFGDNDTLAGLVANLIEAEYLVILSDQPGLRERDPRQDPEAPLIREGFAGDPALRRMAGDGGAMGRGGMKSKLEAAVVAAKSGTDVVIADGRDARTLERLAAGERVGTLLRAGRESLAARKRWLASQSLVRGRLRLDAGAVLHLRERGKSLLAVGVTLVEGDFRRGDIVALLDPDGHEIGRGLSNYAAGETRRIMRRPSSLIGELLGHAREPELVHRDNLVLL